MFNNFIDRNGLKLCWDHVNVERDNTYANHALRHGSYIDHIAISDNVFDDLIGCEIIRCSRNPSSHW